MKIITTGIMAGVLSSAAVQAGDFTVSMSKATDTVTVLNQSVTTDNNSIALDISRDSLFGAPFVGFGTYYNPAPASGSAMGFYVKPNYTIANSVKLFGKVGYGLNPHRGSSSADYTSMMYGGGVTVYVTDGWGVTAQYDNYGSSSIFETTAVSLGLTYSK